MREFCFDSARGVEAGFTVCTLINLTSVVDVKIYPISKSKKEIWEEMVVSNGAERKIKAVIADASFFAYDNFYLLQNNPIKVKKNIDRKELKKLKELFQTWFDSSTRILSTLLEDFK